jgi:heptaprenyl diphosphate synthase
VINLQDIKKKLTEINQKLEQYIQHPYLRQYVNTPDIDEDRILLFYSLFANMNIPDRKISEYTITTMLIQLALDTHDLVITSAVDNPNTMKNQQLTVLAGDYYSGLYYYMLANLDDLTMIRVLAEAIRDINEHKISFYQNDAKEIEQLINNITIIESALFQKLADHFQTLHWKQLASHLFIYKRLMAERWKFDQFGSSPLFDSMRRILFPKTTGTLFKEQKQYLLHVCNSYMEHSKKLIETLLNKIPLANPLLEERLKAIIFQPAFVEKKIVEEG